MFWRKRGCECITKRKRRWIGELIRGTESEDAEIPAESSPVDVIAVVLLPPTVARIAWWLLLDKPPARKLQSANS